MTIRPSLVPLQSHHNRVALQGSVYLLLGEPQPFELLLYPRWQFGADGEILAGLPEVMDGPHLPHSGRRTDLCLVVPRTPLPFRHAGRGGRCAKGTGNGSRERHRSTRPGLASTTNRLATGLVCHEGG
jgi:hypothetical protein